MLSSHRLLHLAAVLSFRRLIIWWWILGLVSWDRCISRYDGIGLSVASFHCHGSSSQHTQKNQLHCCLPIWVRNADAHFTAITPGKKWHCLAEKKWNRLLIEICRNRVRWQEKGNQFHIFIRKCLERVLFSTGDIFAFDTWLQTGLKNLVIFFLTDISLSCIDQFGLV